MTAVAGHVPRRELPDVPLNRACRLDAWSDPDWLTTFRALGFVLPGNLHRKAWEWTQCIHGLERLGALGPAARVLGVGAGHEWILYYLANRSRLVVATDLYAGAFSGGLAREAAADFLTDPDRYAPFIYRRERLAALPANGLQLPFATGTFDVTYSLSSIEHFGGHHAAQLAMREKARVTRPGGIVCVATEWIFRGGPHPEFFTTPDLARHIADVPGLRLLEEVDFTPPEQEAIDDPITLDDPERVPHIVLRIGDLYFTSIMLFFRRI